MSRLLDRLTVSRAFTKSVLDAHSLLGIVFAAAVYIVCLSGTVAVLTDEFAIWERPDAPVVTTASPELLARVAAEAYARAKAEGVAHDLFVIAPDPLLPRLSASAHDHGREIEWTADAQGNLGPLVETPWTTFMRDHHYNLHLPAPFGAYLVGIVGTILLGSLISGVLAHRRILKDAFRLRWGGSRRLSNADLHNRIGIWALPFHLIVSLTGSLLGLAGIIIGVLAMIAYQGDQEKAIAALTGPQPTEDARPAPLPDILPMIAQIDARTPGAPISFVMFQHMGTRGQIVGIATAEEGHLSRQEGWTFSADGRFLAKAGLTDGNLGMRIYGMLQPLHFGTYGGIGLKLIYVALGMGLTMTVATGLNIWLARRRDQGRAAPRRERLWAGLVWGQAPAFALAALAELFGLAAALPVFWVVVVLTLVASILAESAVVATRRLQLLGAVSLLAVAVAHRLLRADVDPVSLSIDAALFVGGLLLARLGWSAMRGRPAMRPRAGVALDTAGG